MTLKQDLINTLPPYGNTKIKVVQKQGTADIEEYMMLAHEGFGEDYDTIYHFFDTGNTFDTCDRIWAFLKYDLSYNAESGKDQSVKGPSGILHNSPGVDCKHYSLFAGGVLDAIKRNEGDGFEWCFAFASETDPTYPTHVFVIVKDKGREIWIDPCLSSFNQRKNYLLLKREKPMALYVINGTSDGAAINQQPKNIDVDSGKSWASFLALLNLDFASLKNLFLDNPQVVSGPIRAYCNEMGFDYNQLITFLNS
jgi:hypothetical protein